MAHVARLKITLDHSKPMIVRRIEVPLTSSLHTLHEAIQAVMLFENYHLFRFDVGPRGHETGYGIPDLTASWTSLMPSMPPSAS